MRADSPGQLLLVVVLVFAAGVVVSVDAALSSISRVRAEGLADEGRTGSAQLVRILADPRRYLSTLLLLRLTCEIAAIVLVTVMARGSFGRSWETVVVTIAVMVVVSFVVVGVGPRTLGRQHDQAIALASATVLIPVTRALSPLLRLLVLLGNALTPGKGFSEGPFASEAELRELVDLAEASSVIESGERAMIHSVFELGDTIAREVMVPRTEVVYIEQHRTLRQAMSLFLRSGFSRLPVIGEDLDHILGFCYLKDVSRRVFDRSDAQTTERVDSMMRPVLHVPDSKPVDDLLRDMQTQARHIAVVVDEYGGTAGLVTIEDVLEEIVGEIADEFDAAEEQVAALDDGSFRVPARFPIDDLVDVVGVRIEDDEIDSVGGLMAKHLGKVPIPGSVVEYDGLVFTAEEAKGRRKRIGTVLIAHVPSTPTGNPTGAPTGTGDPS